MHYEHILIYSCYNSRADMIGAVIAMITGVLLLIRISAGYMDAGLAGLALSWALQFVPQVNWLVRNYTQGKPAIINMITCSSQ